MHIGGGTRLKGAIDSRIAEEQARQKTVAGSSAPVSRSNSTAKQPSSRTASPSTGTRPRRAKPKDGDASPARGPDPSEFEDGAFVIEDEAEDVAAGAAIDGEKIVTAEADTTREVQRSNGEGENVPEKVTQSRPHVTELPADVRAKLQRLENLQSKYKGSVAKPFEKALKENTPLATISDPDALVEYLTQLNLKGDMVMDELKRVSADRDRYKTKFEDSEKEAIAVRGELEALKSSSGTAVKATGNEQGETLSMAETVNTDPTTPSVKSPVSSVLKLFSPKQKPESALDNQDVGEDFFSYDEELPKLQAQVNGKTAEVEGLKSRVTVLETELAMVKKSSVGNVEELETAHRELSTFKEAISLADERLEQIETQSAEIKTLKSRLTTTEEQLSALEAHLAEQQKQAAAEKSLLNGEIAGLKESSDQELRAAKIAKEQFEVDRKQLDIQMEVLRTSREADAKQIEELADSNKLLMNQLKEETGSQTNPVDEPDSKPASANNLTVPPQTTGGAKKKKNNKKKKTGNVAAAVKEASQEKDATHTIPTPIASDSQAEISRLKEEILDRDRQIEKLQTKRKLEADLREELENMQDNFLQIGQEHVEAKEKIKELQGEKSAFQAKLTELESEVEIYKSKSEESDKMRDDLQSLTADYESLKSKSATLQKDLGAAQQLAASRYRDLTDLRDVLQKAQPELKSLREESTKLKTVKDELATRTSELRRLEARERDLRSDVNSFKKQAADREGEIRTLNEKVTQETNGRLRAEDQARVAQRDMRKSEAERIKLAASGEKISAELGSVQEEGVKLRAKVHELEDEVTKLTGMSKGLSEEVDLRSTQFNNAQSLLGSMRDQSAEMAMQLKEAKDQSESLEEELAEVQRLLSERTREGETMRRLLADVDDRADAKLREMRERMEIAIEERDRAEDEASTNGRKKAREAEELKTKLRDLERDLKRAIDDRDEFQQSEKEWKRKRDDLEGVSERASQEVSEVRSAMVELRNALDGSEKQVRDAEKQRGDLRRLLEEANQRYEKLQKELKSLQAKQTKLNDRSSGESGRAGSPNGTGGRGASADPSPEKNRLPQESEYMAICTKRI
ncbi:putative Golgin IMH1 [Glarea lozoyensis 74030]|uniref:Putative Golgin IMH1 n=1 Tax=Glarea lozoyensis (strain ATCC 74030 / MF5533) TaxID=1104152 RepID=H0EYP5_GLAL7|nr:putative Golgin IMH1 [Glarea lozoyensis 74030]